MSSHPKIVSLSQQLQTLALSKDFSDAESIVKIIVSFF